jgi:ATP-binding cassette subfamily F protein 3
MRPIRTMSAGERSKVALARLLLGGANVLLLDEPTNHLDIEAREAVEGTLTQFPDTILFVSHDRYFIETESILLATIQEVGRVVRFSSLRCQPMISAPELAFAVYRVSLKRTCYGR